ncbi:unnamed protein product [Bemisia tabaci]|uniref:BTB domain-containing protein n=1 Tax=Bemisia tabaci TaxID=7038 RepID=A0A9P0AFB8_BEMTA|nr:unnamed protein product [Bemisia tabaci]
MAEKTDWRFKKQSLTERLRHIFESKMYSNVNFIVGKDLNTKLAANKLILAAGSELFHRMFVDNMGILTVIEVPDVEAPVFEAFIRFLYTDEAVLKQEIAFPLLYLSKKYGVPGLTNRCLGFLKNSLNPSNVFTLLLQAVKVGCDEVQEDCFKIIDDYTLESISSEDFLKVDDKTLLKILCRDSLKIREIDLFQAIVKWSRSECTRRNIFSTVENQRLVLKEPLSLIRFPTMTLEEFSSKVAASELLAEKEVISLFLYFNGVNNSSNNFVCKHRAFGPRLAPTAPKSVASSMDVEKEPGEIPDSELEDGPSGKITGQQEDFVVERFRKVKNKWVYLDYDRDYDEIGFHVDHDVKLNAVSLYGAKNPHFAEYRSSIEVVDRNTKELLGKVKYLNLTSSDEKYKVSFEQPISLTAFKKYSIRVKIEGPPSLYGCQGHKKVKTELPSGRVVSVTFSTIDERRTNVEMGQVPALYLTLHES